MKEKATLYDYARLCKANNRCLDCPLGVVNTPINTKHCAEFISVHPDKANEIILKWCKEHPIKTRQDEFLKMFPNARIGTNGAIGICPLYANKNFSCKEIKINCKECRKEFWLTEVDENE